MTSWTQRPLDIWHWTTSKPSRGLAMALALTAALRLPFLGGRLTTDEGGYLYVAQHWFDGGPHLYGAQWVDRPPLLILIFKFCDLLGGSAVVVRLVALGVALLLVIAAYDIGKSLAGPRGAVAGSLATAAIGSNALILGDDLVGDAVGAMFIAFAAALMMRALDAGWPAGWLLAGAGALSSAAFLTKQSALLGFVFAAVLIIAERRIKPALAYGAGAVVPFALTAIWAWAGPGMHELISAVYTFRIQSAHLLWSSDIGEGPAVRGLQMVGLVAATGLIAVLILAFGTPFGERRDPIISALLAAGLAYFAFSTIYSLNYYNYYLLALTPIVAIAVPAGMARGWWLDDWAIGSTGLCMVAAVVAAFFGNSMLATQASGRLTNDRVAVADAIKSQAHPGDTVVVLYGNPNVIQATGLKTPYPYSWSLIARVKDPDQKLLTSTLEGPQAPTWVAEIGSVHDWGYGTPELDQVLAQRYTVQTVAGHRLFRLAS